MFLILLAGIAQGLTANYNIVVEENGDALAVVGINGEGTANLPLPLDAVAPVVKDALYVQATNGIDVSLGSTGTASVVFESSLLTGKSGDTWVFTMELGDFESSTVTLSLPKGISIVSTSPKATITQSRNSMNVLWTSVSGSVEASYTFTGGTVAPGVPTTEESGDNTLILVTVIIVAVVIVILAFLTLKKK